MADCCFQFFPALAKLDPITAAALQSTALGTQLFNSPLLQGLSGGTAASTGLDTLPFFCFLLYSDPLQETRTGDDATTQPKREKPDDDDIDFEQVFTKVIQI